MWARGLVSAPRSIKLGPEGCCRLAGLCLGCFWALSEISPSRARPLEALKTTSHRTLGAPPSPPSPDRPKLPQHSGWDGLFASLNMFSEDFLSDWVQPEQAPRELCWESAEPTRRLPVARRRPHP